MKMIKAIDKFNEIHKELEQEEKSLSDERKYLYSSLNELRKGQITIYDMMKIIRKQDKQSIKRLKGEYLKLGTRVFNNKSDQDVIDLIDKIFGKKLAK